MSIISCTSPSASAVIFPGFADTSAPRSAAGAEFFPRCGGRIRRAWRRASRHLKKAFAPRSPLRPTSALLRHVTFAAFDRDRERAGVFLRIGLDPLGADGATGLFLEFRGW